MDVRQESVYDAEQSRSLTTMITTAGFIAVLMGAGDMVSYESELFAYSPAGQIAIAHVFGVSHGSSFDAGHWSVQTLHVGPTAVSQKPALSVVIGPPTFGFADECAGNFWSWHYRDLDADGWPEIQIGPRVGAEGNITPTATFRLRLHAARAVAAFRWAPPLPNQARPRRHLF